MLHTLIISHCKHAENPIFTKKLHKVFWVEGFCHGPVELHETRIFFIQALRVLLFIYINMHSTDWNTYTEAMQHLMRADTILYPDS